MNIFPKMLGSASFYAIQYMSEDALANASEVDKAALTRILQANKLDECSALAHEHLGEHDEAKHLRDFMRAKSSKAPDPHLPELLAA